MKKQIKELRVKIDGLSQLVKNLKTKKTQVDIALKTKQETIDDFLNRVESEKLGVEIIEQSEQIKKCYDSLLLAKAWLGKVLGELGENTPYANDGNRKTVEDIEPTADVQVWTYFNDGFKDKSHIEKVDWLRQEIQAIIDLETNDTLILFDLVSRSYFIWAFKHLCEARFWLGFELERIRESSGGNI